MNRVSDIERIRQARDQYLALASDCTDDDITHLVIQRLAMVLWRQGLLHHYAKHTPQWSHADRLRYLLTVGIYIPQELRAQIAQTLGPEQYAQLMAHHGIRTKGAPENDLLAGPDLYLPIIANRRSRWPFERWCEEPRFSEYLYQDDAVFYRGIRFLPGDVLLTNTNRDGNGIYTTNSVPAGHFPHSGFFALLAHKKRRFPCVMETFEFGVRAVPLNIFLHPRFSSYVEVHRHRDMATQHSNNINSCARALMQNTKGYNFYTDDPDRAYVSCTTIGQCMFQDAGLSPITRRSRSDPKMLQNLASVGYTLQRMMFPIDYLRDPRTHCVGWVDNHHGTRLLARWYIERELTRQLTTYQLNPAKLPLHSKINFWAIQQVRGQTVFTGPLKALSGFDQHTLPKGPDRTLAIITVLEKALGKKIRAFDNYLRNKVKETPTTRSEIHELLNDIDLMQLARRLVRFRWLGTGS